MKRPQAATGSIVFFLAAPCVVAGVLPWLLTGWRVGDTGSYPAVLAVAGAGLIVVGLVLVTDSFTRFVVDGRGTPAPVAPTEELVVTGIYRWVRNPMYVGVVLVILGQAAALRRPSLLLYGACVAVAMASFVHWYEEPTLRARYGARYDDYHAAVPAWRPWRRRAAPPEH